jgi:excisionase family DNA binding protein
MALWRVEEAADFLGIRPKTLYEWVRTDRVPYRKLGFNVRFDPDELEEWVRQQPAGGDRSGGKRNRGSRSDGVGDPSLAGPAAAEVEALAEVGAEAARRLHRVEADLGAQLSFPERQDLRDLARRLKEAVTAVRGSGDES